MLAVLTGIGLSASAGLNAYIPLLVIGLLGRYTHLIQLPSGWMWLDNGWTLIILGVLLAIEVVADKIPAIDSANDVLHTVIRPTAGGLAFGAASESTTVTSDPGSFFTSHQWVPVAAGVLIAFVVHGTKAAARPVINASTVGTGAPVVSTIEDVFSVVMSVVAIVLPILVLLFLVIFVLVAIWMRRKIKARRARRRALKAEKRAAAVANRVGPPAGRPLPAGTQYAPPPGRPAPTRSLPTGGSTGKQAGQPAGPTGKPPAPGPQSSAPTRRLPASQETPVTRELPGTTQDLRRPE